MLKNQDPLVSIIMPTYNSEKFIAESIYSVINQTYLNWELLITDDSSQDKTIEIINGFIKMNSRIKLYCFKRNSGAAKARNNSLAKSNGDFIAFLDSDDVWEETKLRDQIEFMTKGIDFSFTAYRYLSTRSDYLNRTVDTKNKSRFDYFDMLKKKATLGCSTVMLRREAFPSIVFPNIRTGQDYALWLKLLYPEKKAYLLNKVLTSYRIVPNSISRNKLKKAKRQFQIYRKIEGLNYLQSIYYFLYYAKNAIFRKK